MFDLLGILGSSRAQTIDDAPWSRLMGSITGIAPLLALIDNSSPSWKSSGVIPVAVCS